MAHQRHLEKTKFRQWVKAGLGLDYLREGLLPFCDDIINQQHKDILDKIKPTAQCSQCSVKTLKPNHKSEGSKRNKQCPLGQANCSCFSPSGKIPCPNNVCGAIYDDIIRNHGYSPPAPNWKNTNAQKWCMDPWSTAVCFINVPGYDKKPSADDIDCTGLLHVIINNQYFHNHIMCQIDGNDPFSKVRQYRNQIFHSSTMELEETDANMYIDNMITVLQDGKELHNRLDAQNAVKKLQELKNGTFIITTKNEADVVHAAVQALTDKINVCEEKLKNVASTDTVQDLEKRVTTLESDMAEVKQEMKNMKTDRASKERLHAYIKSKLEFQKKMICYYNNCMFQVSAMPFEPEAKDCNFSEVYVQPRMVSDTKYIKRRTTEVPILSISEIFKKDGKSVKSIFVLGEAGSGKTFFCKSLVNCWCLAHAEEQDIKDEFGGIEAMKNFEFLFYISLRHCRDEVTIKKMIKKQFDDKFIKTLLDDDCANILVVLDGLDEWTPTAQPSNQFQTEGLPLYPFKDYTVLYTSRLWHVRFTNVIQHQIELKGFDTASVDKMIANTVTILNRRFEKSKSSQNCENDIDDLPFEDISHIPIILQHLICLWFDDKLLETSRSAIYTRMLDLSFVWNNKKSPAYPLLKTLRETSEYYSIPVDELPFIFKDTELCTSYTYLIQVMSRLAHETLRSKERSLTFESSIFEKLKIRDEERTCCLKLGILTEESCPSLSASQTQRTLFSFVHKSVQEFLAAIHGAITFKSSMKGNTITSENCRQFAKDFFKCRTVDDILEQANIFIMLCGLEPRTATFISKYVYDICTRDECVLDYRGNIEDPSRHYKRVLDIQKFIQDTMKEVEAYQELIQSAFYLGDIVVDDQTVSDYFCTSLDKEYVLPDSVLSFRINILSNAENLGRIFKFIAKCQQIEAIGIYVRDDYPRDNEDINYMYEAFDVNASTLKAVSVSLKFEKAYNALSQIIIRRVLETDNLIALSMEGVVLTHENCNLLCTFISVTCHLEQISLKLVCECNEKHELDLSGHKCLKYLNFDNQIFVTSANTANLETFKFADIDSSNCVKIFDTLSTVKKLRELELGIASTSEAASLERISNSLITLLPHLSKLFQLKLRNFAFTSCILKRPSDMVNLKHIHLFDVRISELEWPKFVDSLCEIPHHVNVNTSNLCITQDGIESSSSADGQYEAALQYVHKHEKCFDVTFDSNKSFSFSTKK